MCMYSLEVNQSEQRGAVAGETLTLVKHGYHGVLQGTDGKTVCVKPGTKLVGTFKSAEHSFLQPDTTYLKPEEMKVNFGKRRVVTLVEFARHGQAGDAFKFKDGKVLHLNYALTGIKMAVHVPKKRKRNLVKALGLDNLPAPTPDLVDAD